jgi:hypothetical protein
MRKVKFIVSLFVLVLLGCSDISESEKGHIQNQADPKLLEYLKTTASVLGNLITDPEIRSEIVYGVALDYQGDSQILLAHLLDESDKAFYARKSPSKFRKEFLNKLGVESERGRIAGTSDFIDYLTGHNVGIYAPYFSFHDWNEDITITYHPLNNESSNYGIHYMPDNSGSYITEEVIVDDSYAVNNPTLILLPVEDCPDCIEACPSDLCINPVDNATSSLPTLPRDADCRNYGPQQIITVYMTELMLDTHWDDLFGGATEVTAYRAEGAIDFSKPNLAGASVYKLIDDLRIKREHIKNKRWVSSTITYFDDNWKIEESNQVIALYDKDDFPVSFKDLKGEVSVGVKDGKPSFDVKVSAQFERKDAERGYLKYYNQRDRCAMMAKAKTNIGNGLRNGWMIQREAGLNWYWRWEVR